MRKINGNAIMVVAKQFPKSFSPESVQQMIENGIISYESAANLLSIIDPSMASEADNFMEMGDKPNTAQDHIREAKARYFEDLKFKALLECVKEDDTMLYEDFVSVDNARRQIMAKIVQQKEGALNDMLNEVKAAYGCDPTLIDGLIKTRIRNKDWV